MFVRVRTLGPVKRNSLIFAQEQRQPRGGLPVCSRSNLSSRVCTVKLRPRICYVLSVLRIHSSDCEHCAAHLTCGVELRERLEELNGLAERENGERRQQRGEPRPSPFNRLA